MIADDVQARIAQAIVGCRVIARGDEIGPARAFARGERRDQIEQSFADDLAAKIGKSRTHVYNRLKLLALVGSPAVPCFARLCRSAPAGSIRSRTRSP